MEELKHICPDITKIPGGFIPTEELLLERNSVYGISFLKKGIIVIDHFLNDNEINNLINYMNLAPKLEPVGINGFMDNIENVGSNRVTMWAEQLSKEVWKKLDESETLSLRTLNSKSPTDWWQGDKFRKRWQPHSVSPMMRFMKYEKGGEHYAHYDAGFIYPNDNYRTLMSYVIYLTDAEEDEGGSTRFIKDNQENIPVWDRNHDDWTRRTYEEEVDIKVTPKKGRILLFDHRLCHDVEPYLGDNRIIIRGDVIFKNV